MIRSTTNLIKILLAVMTMSISVDSFSQRPIHISQKQELEQLFSTDVSSLYEFFERFNNTADTTFQSRERMKNILSLFDRSSEAILSQESVVMDFSEEILSDRYQLSIESPFLLAEARVNAVYKKKDISFTLLLKMEKLYDEIYRWAICGADGLISAGIINKAELRSVNPTDNELEFIDLPDRFQNDTKNAFGYRTLNYNVDQLSILLFLIQEKIISINYVENLKYTMLSIPGYMLTIEHRTNKGNSGWLITEISKITSEPNEIYDSIRFGKN